ncbi:hypothetical protein ACHAXS_010476 [Conticribra weissflogii]
MCGRASYTARSVSAAAVSLEAVGSSSSTSTSTAVAASSSTYYRDPDSGNNKCRVICRNDIIDKIDDHPNLSPGNVVMVFRRAPPSKHSSSPPTTTDEKPSSNAPIVECTPMIWGLLPQRGTSHRPHHLPRNPDFSASPHYKLFNARSETVYEKRSFANLILNGQTCLFSVEGYYEWTHNDKPSPAGEERATKTKLPSGDKRKQPYFFHRHQTTRQSTLRHKPLLLAGIWSSVATGRRCANTQFNEANDATTNDYDGNDEMITTFALLTMDAHPKYSWIHDRQPVILWDDSMALEWLMNPSPELLRRIRTFPSDERRREDLESLPLEAHPVTKKINDGKYRGEDCTREVKLETVPSVKSFFVAGSSYERDRKDFKAAAADSGDGRDGTRRRQQKLPPSFPSYFKSSDSWMAANTLLDSSPAKAAVPSTKPPSKPQSSKANDSKKRKGGHGDIASFFKVAKKTL